MKTIYHLAISRLKYNKGRSLLTIVAIALMTTLLMSIGSSALTVIRHQQLEIEENARNYHAAFKGSTADQVFILENHSDVESLSTREIRKGGITVNTHLKQLWAAMKLPEKLQKKL